MDLLGICFQGSISPTPKLSSVLSYFLYYEPNQFVPQTKRSLCHFSLQRSALTLWPLWMRCCPIKLQGYSTLGYRSCSYTNGDQIRLNLCLGSYRNCKWPLCYFTNAFVHQRVTMWSFRLASSFGSEGHLSNSWDVSVVMYWVCFNSVQFLICSVALLLSLLLLH